MQGMHVLEGPYPCTNWSWEPLCNTACTAACFGSMACVVHGSLIFTPQRQEGQRHILHRALLQVYDTSEAGQKLKAFYRLFELPVTMVIDPVTGAALKTFAGAIEAHRCAAIGTKAASRHVRCTHAALRLTLQR